MATTNAALQWVKRVKWECPVHGVFISYKQLPCPYCKADQMSNQQLFNLLKKHWLRRLWDRWIR